MSKPPAQKSDNVLPFPQVTSREREPTQLFDRGTTATPEKTIAIYAPPPGETFDLFKVNELKAGELLQILIKPVTAAFIILRGTVEELARDANGYPIVVREIEAGEMVNASLFARGADLSGTEVALRAKTDLLFYVVTPDDTEAYDVAKELRDVVRHKRQRCVDDAKMQNYVGLLKNRNAAAAAAAGWQAKAEELNRLLLETLQERVAEIVAKQIKPLREENTALRPWVEAAFEHVPELHAEIERLLKDRIVDMQSLEITLDGMDELIVTEVEQGERRIAELVVVVEDSLLMALGLSETSEKSEIMALKQKASDALSELFTFKMKAPKAFKKGNPAT